jgi:hypothetical protein
MSTHALLSPSAAHRWLNCPPSARLCEDVADQTSAYAEEGSQAHELCEYKLHKFLGQKANDPRKHLSYYDQTMEDATDDYLGFCTAEFERLKAHGEPFMAIEQRVRYEEYVPEGSGSADCVIIAGGEMVVCDMKYGAGIAVSAEDNPQLRLYALGCLLAFDPLYDIKTVKMCIIQPRRENIATATMTKEALYHWAETVVRPAAELAWSGEGEQKSGEHCQFCKIKATCRARANANMELARFEFEEPTELDAADIAVILSQADEFTRWISDVKDYALAAALSGTTFPGFKVVEGRSNRKYANEEAVAQAVEGIGFDPFERKLFGITAMTALLGKKRFEETLSAYIEKPQGKPVLVPETDKRQAFTANTAADDFADHNLI